MGVRGKDFEIKKVGLDGENWLGSESFWRNKYKRKKNRKGLGRKRVLELREVLEYWSQIGTVEGTLEDRSFGYQNFF